MNHRAGGFGFAKTVQVIRKPAPSALLSFPLRTLFVAPLVVLPLLACLLAAPCSPLPSRPSRSTSGSSARCTGARSAPTAAAAPAPPPASRPSRTSSTWASATAASGRRPTTAASGADLRRPADRLDRRHRRRPLQPERHLRRQRRGPAAARPVRRRRHLQIDRRGQDLDAPRPARRPADPADHRRSPQPRPRLRRGARPPLRPERGARHLPLHRRRPDVPEGPLQGREHGRLRARLRPVQSRHRLRRALGIAAGALGERRIGTGPGGGIFKSTDGGTTWRQLTDGLPTLARTAVGQDRHRQSPRASPRRLYAPARPRAAARASIRSDDAGETWTRVNSDTARRRASAAATSPRSPSIRRTRTSSSSPASSPGNRPTAARRSRRSRGAPGGDDYQNALDQPRRTPTSSSTRATRAPSITVNGGETWSSWYNQPTAQLYHVARRQRLPLPRLRRPAGERLGLRLQPRQRRPDHLPRLASGRRRRVRLRGARPARSRTSSTAAERHPLRPPHRPGRRTSRPKPRPRGGDYRTDPHPAGASSRRSTRTRCTSPSNVLWKTTDGGQSWTADQPRPDPQDMGRCRRASASTRDDPKRPSPRGEASSTRSRRPTSTSTASGRARTTA